MVAFSTPFYTLKNNNRFFFNNCSKLESPRISMFLSEHFAHVEVYPETGSAVNNLPQEGRIDSITKYWINICILKLKKIIKCSAQNYIVEFMVAMDE